MPHPYKYIAAFYYYSLVAPLKFVVNVWEFGSSLTGYGNINLIIGGIFVIIYLFGVLPAVAGLVYEVVGKLKIDNLMLTIMVLPGAFALVWLAFSSLIGWLFAK